MLVYFCKKIKKEIFKLKFFNIDKNSKLSFRRRKDTVSQVLCLHLHLAALSLVIADLLFKHRNVS